ncbi:hypothetical protein D3C87_1168070 [compost metagenome]
MLGGNPGVLLGIGGVWTAAHLENSALVEIETELDGGAIVVEVAVGVYHADLVVAHRFQLIDGVLSEHKVTLVAVIVIRKLRFYLKRITVARDFDRRSVQCV